MKMNAESNSLARISAYMDENRINSALEVEAFQNMALETNVENSDDFEGGLNGHTSTSESRRLDAYMTTSLWSLKKMHFNPIRKYRPKTP